MVLLPPFLGPNQGSPGQGGSLASIHSPEEQEQAVSVCKSMRTDANTGATVAGDQATHGGYGCWIGFEDSAQDGGL